MMGRPSRVVAAAAYLALTLVAGCGSPPAPIPPTYDVSERSIAALSADLAAGRVTSERLVDLYTQRIRSLDHAGPTLRSVIAINPRVSDDARALDRERADGHVRGPLHGIPLLLKDNIESADPMPTTAGSLALAQNLTGRDAAAVGRLRAAGAVILGKTNLSEWAHFRGNPPPPSGWSAVGGLTLNPYDPQRNACGSSSGSGAATAANFAAAALGTDTDGSIACPSAVNGLVGLRPTLGLVSRRHVVPISPMQDTVGPMARTVTDAALLLAVMAGTDAQDPETAEADRHVEDYVAALKPDALAGKRLGVVRAWMGYSPALDAVFEARLDDLRAAGATIVPISTPLPLEQAFKDEFNLLAADFRPAINAYLATTPPSVTARTLADLIAFNKAHADKELRYAGQQMFEQAEASAGKEREWDALRSKLLKQAREDGIDALLKKNDVVALIAPSFAPAWTNDLVNGDHVLGGIQGLHAIGGYPHLTVPMGQVMGLPVGLSFIGPGWSDAALLSFAYAFEQRTHARQSPTLPLPAAGTPRP